MRSCPSTLQLLQSAKLGHHISRIPFQHLIRLRAPIATRMCLRLNCGAHFHPAHYYAHREEWPCPTSKEDWCLWCDQYIQEHENKAECIQCHCKHHACCFPLHLPCPDGWAARETAEDVPERTVEPEAIVKLDVQMVVARIEALGGATAQPK